MYSKDFMHLVCNRPPYSYELMLKNIINIMNGFLRLNFNPPKIA